MSEHESRGGAGTEFFEGLLADGFTFRRANGTSTDRTGFLEALGDAGNATESLTTTVRQIQVLGDQAFVEAHVHLIGRRGVKPVDATFRNLRLFEYANGEWRLVMWFNRRITEGG